MPAGRIGGKGSGYVVRAASNDDFRLMNRLHKAHIPFSLVTSPETWKKKTGADVPAGSVFIGDAGAVRSAMPGLLDGISSQLAVWGIRIPR